MVNAKENLNPVFRTTRNHFEIELRQPSSQSTFGNWRANPKIAILNNNNCNIKQISAKDLTCDVFVWIQFHLTWKSWQLQKHTGSSLYVLILFDTVIWPWKISEKLNCENFLQWNTKFSLQKVLVLLCFGSLDTLIIHGYIAQNL